MLVILKNAMNDLYARDTSSKIKAVNLSTFKSGKYVGCYAPLGYKKSEADKHVLEIDPVAAPVVRHIFDLRLQGYGFRKIALQLNAEKVPSPRSFYYMAEDRENLRGETPFWNDVTVKTILRFLKKIAAAGKLFMYHNLEFETFAAENKLLSSSPVSCFADEIAEFLDRQIEVLFHTEQMADIFETPYIRMFSFYIPEKHFSCTFDFTNFIQCGQKPLKAYEMLSPYIHVKDALLATGEVVPAGTGNRHLPEIFQKLDASGYYGFLSLEPHLANFSGLAALEHNDDSRRKQHGKGVLRCLGGITKGAVIHSMKPFYYKQPLKKNGFSSSLQRNPSFSKLHLSCNLNSV